MASSAVGTSGGMGPAALAMAAPPPAKGGREVFSPSLSWGSSGSKLPIRCRSSLPLGVASAAASVSASDSPDPSPAPPSAAPSVRCSLSPAAAACCWLQAELRRDGGFWRNGGDGAGGGGRRTQRALPAAAGVYSRVDTSNLVTAQTFPLLTERRRRWGWRMKHPRRGGAVMSEMARSSSSSLLSALSEAELGGMGLRRRWHGRDLSYLTGYATGDRRAEFDLPTSRTPIGSTKARVPKEEEEEEEEEEEDVGSTRVSRPMSDPVVGPNLTVAEAIGRVCTGPTMTRPMDQKQARSVLEAILKSVHGELSPDERVSSTQLGAFFGGMTLRASSSFPPATRWSEGESAAMAEFWPYLRQELPEDVLFLADPDGSIFGGPSTLGGGGTSPSMGPTNSCRGSGGGGTVKMRLVEALRKVLGGEHLGFDETKEVLRESFPPPGRRGGEEEDGRRGGEEEDGRRGAEEDGTGLRVLGGRKGVGKKPGAGGEGGDGNAPLVAALLICQRMNRETDEELMAYCTAFDQDTDTIPVANVRSLTHYGEPYDGNTRFMKSTLFVAAVRACYGEASLLHGIDWMPPKRGVTEETILKHLEAGTSISLSSAVALLEDEEVGFAYLSQKDIQPSLYAMRDSRVHIKKRPAFATTEKVQRFVKATGRESMMAGYYHEGYEQSVLMLMHMRGVDAGLVIKGEEGSSNLTLREASKDAKPKGHPVNFCSGFQQGSQFSLTLDGSQYGFAQSPTPRVDRKVEINVKLGMEALRGQKGPAYDRIVLNAAMADHLLGCSGAEDLSVSIERAKDAVDSGRALRRLEAYIQRSRQLSLERR